MGPYKDFPPGWGHIWVPVSSRRAASAGLSMYTPCTTKGVLMQRAALATVSVGGSALLPGRKRTFTPPLEDWEGLLDHLRGAHGEFDDMALYERRRSQQRTGILMLLLREGRPVVFVKALSSDRDAVEREASALAAVAAHRPQTFAAPDLRETGTWHAWSYLVTSPLPPVPHRMLQGPPPAEIAAEVAAALGALERDTSVPTHWEPAHGDFTPWNLRTVAGLHTPVLLDWEEAGWAPPGTDAVLYAAALIGLGREITLPENPEAAAYLADGVAAKLEAQQRGGTVDPMTEKLLAALRG